MNRLHPLSLPKIPELEERYEIDQASVTTDQRDSAQYAIFAPLHYEPNYAYPLIVWLHGPNDNETQLQRVMPEVSMRNYVGVCPRGPIACPAGFSWSNCDVDSAEQAVFDCIDAAAEKFHIARQRVFLAGFEGGGSTAFRIGLRHPQFFAGVVSIEGPFPMGQMPLARLAQARRLPLLIAQGRDSQRYPVERTCDELRLFHSAGLCVNLRQYSCQDELDVQMLRDMDAWIMELVTGVPASDSEAGLYDIGELN